MIKPIKGQSVSLLTSTDVEFNEKNEACTFDNETYCQNIYKNQFTQFQVQLTPTTGIDLTTNGNFANNINSWTLVGDIIGVHSLLYGGSASLIADTSGSLRQTINGLTIGSHYYVETTVRDFNRVNPSLICNASLFVDAIGLVGDGILFYNSTANISIRDMKIKVWFTATATTHNISVLLTNSSVVVEYVKMYELSRPQAQLTECDGGAVLDASVLLYKDKAIITVNWDNPAVIVDNCYRICVTQIGNESPNLLIDFNAFGDNFGFIIFDNNRVPMG